MCALGPHAGVLLVDSLLDLASALDSDAEDDDDGHVGGGGVDSGSDDLELCDDASSAGVEAGGDEARSDATAAVTSGALPQATQKARATTRPPNQARGDARLLLESYVPSLHLTYLVLLGTSAVQRKVVRTIDVSSFENSLAEITLYCASDEGASRSSGSARCAAFWQKLGKNRPFQGGAAPSLLSSAPGHKLPTAALAFSDDEQVLASGSADKNLKACTRPPHKE